MHPHYFFLFFIILVVATVSKSDNEQDPICPPIEFICGEFNNISYPFSVEGSTAKCSYSGFELYCDNDYPVIDISSKEYRVKSIDYSSQTLIIVDTGIIGNNCSPPSANSELDFSIFTYADNDVNLTLYSNCPEAISNYDLHSVSCLGNDASFSYYTTQASALYPYPNCSVSNFTLLDSVADRLSNNSLNFEVAVNEGFNVSWIVDYGKCENCVNSGGNCSIDPIAGDEPICYCGNGHYPQKCPSRSNKMRTIAIAVGVCGGFLVVVICITACLCYRKKQRTSSTSKFISRTISSDPSYNSELGKCNSILPTHVFSYEELQEATNNFDESKQLGEGGFGTVYHGKLRDGRTVAVKRLYESNYRRVEQFMNEVEILSRLSHQNLVSLYGCTSRHSRELLLVYEFVPNGTVADHIHGDHAKSRALTWPIRMSIAIESADALAYLHAVDIIHRDVKTNNILLDNNFCVKVADFGLSRLFPLDKTHVSTAPQGTPGYVDPDYHRCYQLNDKSDVYSFGVVLFELVSSKPAVDITRNRHEINLSNMAITKIQNHALHELVDPSFGFETDSAVRREITLVAELAFRCLHDEKDTRPSMDEVFTVLREIQSEKFNMDKVNVVDIQTDDDAIPLKEIPPLSPNSVTMPWVSSTTTPNISG